MISGFHQRRSGLDNAWGACAALLSAVALVCSGCGEDNRWHVAGGVASRQVVVKARGTDLVTVDLFAPADRAGTADLPADQRLPGLVLCPGGLVDPAQYAWLARRLAAGGMAVAVAHFPSGLGLLAQDNAQVARRVLTQGNTAAEVPALAAAGRVGVAGHSLGAVVAAAVATDGGFAALVLLAGYAAAGDPVESLSIPALSVAGQLDCSASLAQVRAGWLRLPKGALLAVVQGLSHYGFTDSLAPDDKGGCQHPLTLGEGHARVGAVIEQFLLRALVDPALPLPAGITGVALEVRP